MDKKNTRRLTFWRAIGALAVVAVVCGMVLVVESELPPPPTPPKPPSPTSAPAALPPTPKPSVTPGPTSNAASADDFIFDVAGDSRDGPAVFQEVLREVSADKPAFLVDTGDLVDSPTEDQYKAFQAMLAELTVPYYPVPGNHDIWSSPDLYLQYSTAPALHYSFDRGQAHFAFVDSHAGTLSPEETAWLDADLAATQQPLKIVVLHFPPFDPNGSDHILTAGNDEFMALMRERGVSYVFAGHIHAYAAEERDGVTYVITGGAGAPLRGSEAQGGYYHYLRVHVLGAKLTYEVVRIQAPTAAAPLAFALSGRFW